MMVSVCVCVHERRDRCHDGECVCVCVFMKRETGVMMVCVCS